MARATASAGFGVVVLVELQQIAPGGILTIRRWRAIAGSPALRIAEEQALQAMRQHAYVDTLSQPGTADLTAHVHFAGLARKALAEGLAVDGPITQAEFLGVLGLAPRASRLMAANPTEAGAIELAAQRLVAPTGMGSLFKVLSVRSPGLPRPPPGG